jgi:hypothetical protein
MIFKISAFALVLDRPWAGGMSEAGGLSQASSDSGAQIHDFPWNF